MIQIKRGDLLSEDVDALVNTVNCVGVMGKGIALQFKQAFPDNFKEYKKACDRGDVRIGSMFIIHVDTLFEKKIIINFPTKKHWKEKSKIEYIEAGMDDLLRKISDLHITSIAIPPLGCGNGGLEWKIVKSLIQHKLAKLENVNAFLFAPFRAPRAELMRIRTKEPKMTQGRAMLIGLLKRYREIGYMVTLLEIQKLMYFLQETGESLRLRFERGKYGPYANNLHHVLQAIEGHFIKGYGDRTYKSYIRLLPGGVEKADAFLEVHKETLGSFNRVLLLIEGFETPYGLKLLSTVHWTITKEEIEESVKIIDFIQGWTTRKRLLFSPRHIEIAKKRLEECDFLA